MIPPFRGIGEAWQLWYQAGNNPMKIYPTISAFTRLPRLLLGFCALFWVGLSVNGFGEERNDYYAALHEVDPASGQGLRVELKGLEALDRTDKLNLDDKIAWVRYHLPKDRALVLWTKHFFHNNPRVFFGDGETHAAELLGKQPNGLDGFHPHSAALVTVDDRGQLSRKEFNDRKFDY